MHRDGRDYCYRNGTMTVALARATRTRDPRAINVAVRVMERRAKLLGLDAPTNSPVRRAPLKVTVIH
ncbi:MAG TPA: hypothetical protein VKE51_23125 [Vicinamibacterales bacterium]|nr:hypothetical protein [Vicinamibacterales bacterium]